MNQDFSNEAPFANARAKTPKTKLEARQPAEILCAEREGYCPQSLA